MEFDYIITLKKERKKSIDIISFLVVLLSIIAFLAVLIKGNRLFYLFVISIVLLTGCLIYIINLKKNAKPVFFSTMLVIAGLTWMAMPFTPWIALPILLLSILEKPAKRPLDIGFNEEGIIFNNLIRKEVHWSALNNVLMKDGILTLDFRNNRIFQKEFTDNEGNLQEDEFNRYCSKHLSKSFTPTAPLIPE